MRLVWDEIGKKLYETGVSNGVLYPIENGKYGKGVAWNGLSKITESPSGAEPTAIWADNNKYLTLYSAEEFGATVEAYIYPDEFAECDGSAEIAEGITIGQQTRKAFGLAYRTIVGNDVENEKYGYKIHLVYGAKAKPSSKDYNTVNDSPEAAAMSWELSTTPVPVTGFKTTSTLVIESRKVASDKLQKLEDILFGSADTEPRLPLPDEIMEIIKNSTTSSSEDVDSNGGAEETQDASNDTP